MRGNEERSGQDKPIFPRLRAPSAATGSLTMDSLLGTGRLPESGIISMRLLSSYSWWDQNSELQVSSGSWGVLSGMSSS